MSRDLTVLINGGTSEVGRKITQKFAENGHKVIISSDNSELAFEVQKEVFDETGERIDIYIADFASQQEIKEMAEDIENKYPDLNLIINNMSVTSTDQIFSEDEIDVVFQINYLSRFLLTNLLIPTLKQNSASGAGILEICGDVSVKTEINFGNINLEDIYDDALADAQANLADIMYAQTLSEKLASTSIKVNSVNPGKLIGELHGDFTNDNRFETLFKKIAYEFSRMTTVSPDSVSDVVYKLAIDEADKVTGKHFLKMKPSKLPPFAAKKENREQLWKLSNEMTESTFDTF